MYFTIEKTSPLGKKIKALWDRVTASRKASTKWIGEQNNKYSTKSLHKSGSLAGNIIGIEFEKRPKDWCLAKHNFPGFYRPMSTTKNKRIIAEMKSFEIVEEEELNNLLGLQSKKYGANYFKCVRFHENAKVYVIAVPIYVDDWNPPHDMKEIPSPEYRELTQKRALQTQ